MTAEKRRSDLAGRGKLSSPGRPPVANREEMVRFWAAISAGQSSEDAAVAAGVSLPVGSRWFRRSGGMPPTHLAVSAPPLSGRYLSFAEREEIALLRVQGHGVRHISRTLNRAPSCGTHAFVRPISRELRCNAATRGGELKYRATTAQWHAERSVQRPKAAKLAVNDALQDYVQDRLAGLIARPDGTEIKGPLVTWKGRRHGRRQHGRWARAWSPEQVSHIGCESRPIDRPLDHPGRDQSVAGQAGNERLDSPVAKGRIHLEPLSARSMATQPG